MTRANFCRFPTNDITSSTDPAEKSVSILSKPSNPEHCIQNKVTKTKEEKSNSCSGKDSLSFAGKFNSVQKENVPEESPSCEEVAQADNFDAEKNSLKTKSDVMPVHDKETRIAGTDSSETKSDNCAEQVNTIVKVLEDSEEAAKSKDKETADWQVTNDAQGEDRVTINSNIKQTNTSEKEKDEDNLCGEDTEAKNTSCRTYLNKKKKPKQEVSPRRYTSRESDYTDEELDEELRKTSIELQRSLDDLPDLLPSIGNHRRKAQIPVKKTISDVRRSLRGSSQGQKGSKVPIKGDSDIRSPPLGSRPRVCFREVAVSPSIISDDKLVRQVPEVNLNESLLNTHTKPNFVICDTDSEDEIPTSQSSEELMTSKSVILSELPVLSKTTNLPQKDRKDAALNKFSPKLTRSKRKRTMSQDAENSDNAQDKKRKTGDTVQRTTNDKNISSDESVILLEEKGNFEKPKHQRRSKDNQKPPNEDEELLGCNHDNSHSGDAPNETKRGSNTVPKVTRSGRKVVAPNKDMPEPMTPPGTSSLRRKKSLENAVSLVDDDCSVTAFGSSHSKEPSAKRCLQKKITEIFDKERKEVCEEEIQEEIQDEDSFRNSIVAIEENGTTEASTGSVMEDDDIMVPEKLESSTETFAEGTTGEELHEDEEEEDAIHEETVDKSTDSEIVVDEKEEAKAIEQSSEPIELSADSPPPMSKDSEEIFAVPETQLDNPTKAKLMSPECEHTTDTSKPSEEGRSRESSDVDNEDKELDIDIFPCEDKEPQVIESNTVLELDKLFEESEGIDNEDSGKITESQKEIVEKDNEITSINDKLCATSATEKISEHEVKSPDSLIFEESSKSNNLIISPSKTVNVNTAEVMKKIKDIPDQEGNENDAKELEKSLDNVDTQQGTTDVDKVNTSPTANHQQEDQSPDKHKSKLKMAVSTPERLKKKGHFKYAGSRAAMLVACAKQNIKNRGESPTKAHSGG